MHWLAEKRANSFKNLTKLQKTKNLNADVRRGDSDNECHAHHWPHNHPQGVHRAIRLLIWGVYDSSDLLVNWTLQGPYKINASDGTPLMSLIAAVHIQFSSKNS